MAKKAKSSMKLSINVESENVMKHIVNAHGLVCQYRTLNKVPHTGMEKWLLNLIVEGCNAIYQYHNQQLTLAHQQQQEQAKQTEKVTEQQGE